ncbi:4-(cytidine 5'-diphospho)-2-C-methyl-D-erythritol kinase [Candidatus Pacearchaeota archaeon CG1_02_31_27]|nr:MAG: 4-(cytidine 5'-diphospho)-2-C-methyl-D-erythritol kinase [Candidatus Pacearchaeota archaeon CG1_02_31_27]
MGREKGRSRFRLLERKLIKKIGKDFMKSILFQANAKINLYLKILRKRSDGFHQIESIFQSIDLSDFLIFEKSKKDSLTGAVICPESQNIIFKAKKILEKTLNKKLPCRIHLQKTIPIAAGLGGGSADAAATLMALNLLYNLNLSRKKLVEIGVKIGADVPFFFYGGTCKVGGIGEIVTPVRQRIPKFFVIFRPHKRIETKKMYELYDKTGKNFLELAREIYPEIKKLEKYLKNFCPKKFGLSGSGPTMFCGVNNYKLAQKIAEGYRNFNGDIFICRPQSKALDIIKI